MLGKITVSLLIALLVWGNLVSGLGAGLACPDWPLCYGQFLPPLRWDIVLEKGHRVLAMVTGIFLLALCVVRFLKYKGASRSIPILTALLLAVQIPLGGIVVLLKLPVNVTTAHFATAMMIFLMALYLAWHDGVRRVPALGIGGWAGLFAGLTALVLVQSVLGAYVRHSQSGLACGADFPRCLGFWVPPVLSGTVLIHFLHRAAAYLVLVGTLAAWLTSRFHAGGKPYSRGLLVVLVLVGVQILIGVAVIHTGLNVMSAAYHILVAIMILTLLAVAWFRAMGESGV